MTLDVPPYLYGMAIVLLLLGCLFAYVVLLVRQARQRNTYSPLTEDLLRLPGHSLRRERERLLDDVMSVLLEFVFTSIGVVVLWAVFPSFSARMFVLFSGVGYLVFCCVRMRKAYGDIRDISLGLECEEYTGQELNLLMRRHAFVFHDIPYKYGNIDHIVVGNSCVLAIETKGRRKPAIGDSRSREAVVRFDGKSLSFAGQKETSKPIEQARRHAKYLSEAIKKQCGFSFRVIPVVAIPGWHIDAPKFEETGVLVVNPERAKPLWKWVPRGENSDQQNSVAVFLDKVARSIRPISKTTDPDADKYYDFWLNQKPDERSID